MSKKCPKCGKQYETVRKYTNGDKFYVHKASKGHFGFNELSGCYVKNAKQEEKKPLQVTGYSCGNCHKAMPCVCNDPAVICSICGGDEYDCTCDERSYEEQTP